MMEECSRCFGRLISEVDIESGLCKPCRDEEDRRENAFEEQRLTIDATQYEGWRDDEQ